MLERIAPVCGCRTTRRLTIGMCGKHYQRWRMKGSLDLVPRATVETIDGERWLPIVGFEGAYEVSDHGRVRSVQRSLVTSHGHHRTFPGVNLRISVNLSGHEYVHLSAGEDGRGHLVHRLVLKAFIGPCPPGMECCHNNGVHADNRLVNLRWDTRSENTLDQVRQGRHHISRRECCPRGHQLGVPNLTGSVARLGVRTCAACVRGTAKVRYWSARGVNLDVQEESDRFYQQIMGCAAPGVA